jgi:hypothetical protein
MVLARKLHIDSYGWEGTCRCVVNRFEGVGLHSLFLEPDLDCEEMGLKFLGGYGGITVRG